MNTQLTCSASSRSSGEQLFATASRADTWFLVEHTETYGEKALPESGLPPAVRAKLEAAAAAVQNGRVLLIKRGNRASHDGIRFFLAVNHEEDPRLYAFQLGRAEDLLDMDLEAAAREEPAHRGHDHDDPLFLVCTNGKRDPCCASLGLPLYRTLRESVGSAAWQTSHVGGHRFAPNVVALPSGNFYGYVSPDSAGAIAAAERAGHIHLPNFRGRSCYAPHVQAADAFLRRATGHTDLLRFRLEEAHPGAGASWTCRFADRFKGTVYCVHVDVEPETVSVKKSCREAGPVPLGQVLLRGIETYTPPAPEKQG